MCFFDFGDADGSGVSVALGLGEADGDGWRFFDFGMAEGSGVSFGVGVCEGFGEVRASSLFFFVVEAACRFFRGDGVGVGAKIFLILLPNDSSVCPRSATPKSSAMKRRELAIPLIRRMKWLSRSWATLLLGQFAQNRFV
jgi:hypothetical protein